MATSRKNPYAAFNFAVSLDGTDIGGFMEVSGLDTENAVIEYRQGNDQTNATSGNFLRKQPGLERYPNVIFRRGIAGDLTLWTKLRQPIVQASAGPELGTPGQASPSLKVDLQNEAHTVVQSWTLQNAWVSKLSGPSLNAKGNEIAIEAIEVVCDRITLS
ncbi:MAG: phage tail protein [Candidatus Sulfopaludibacter sp.]|nr:phage tail protein [Candidatus Sulfopaludibacter sp.]